ncbi:MAG: protein-glutamate O-methyltransferase CheR [Candidatus Omnitrophica bacterium]|nr:protein-glutamate O-methyltransferase CheR [Candidatus Omnitrophota bacterium]
MIKDIMYENTGVRLKPSKKPLVMARLRKRLEELGCNRFGDYINVLNENEKREMVFFVDAITTNETYFFRHTKQFNYLYEKVFPELSRNGIRCQGNPVKIWSAACSSGEEPYSIAICAREYFKESFGSKVKIFASDVNTKVLSQAQKGVFSKRSVREVPKPSMDKYFRLSEKNERIQTEFFQIREDIVKSVKFSKHNLLKVFPEDNFDIIFIRNAMIYFDESSKLKVITNILRALAPHGYLFISLSENLNEARDRVLMVAPGVYKRV